jgi:nucleoside-diphosphate-sugar epimerase
LQSITADNFRFVEADLNSLDLDELLAGVQYVFHEAGQPGVRRSWGNDFSGYVTANVLATQRLLEAAKNASTLQRLVYASSSSVYGDAERYPTCETDRPQPVSPYGVTKLAAEHLCTLYARNFSVPTVSLRYFTVYGPGQRTDMAFTRFTRAAVQGKPISLYGTGEQVRDFTYVDDVVEANLLAAEADLEPGEIINISGGTNISVNGILNLLGELNGGPLTISKQPKVAGDVFQTGGENIKARELLSWRPQVSIQEGFTRQYDWARRTFGTEE